MKLLLNSTKTMDVGIAHPRTPRATRPRQLEQAEVLAGLLRPLSEARLARLMGLSARLAAETRAAAALWGQPGQPQAPALFAFTGLVYKYIETAGLTADQLRAAQKQVLILSGLYGLLRPLDVIEFYRLEMGSKLQPAGCRNLVEFWKDELTRAVNAELKQGEPVVSVAAQEYVKALDVKRLKGPLISVVFKEEKPDGSLKTVAVHSKMARGALVRHALESGAAEPRDLLGFHELGWEAATEPPADGGDWLFTRPARG
jgi:cytoplasmic iron level regulating protein YaaA (DUF328/UPF0246 family)